MVLRLLAATSHCCRTARRHHPTQCLQPAYLRKKKGTRTMRRGHRTPSKDVESRTPPSGCVESLLVVLLPPLDACQLMRWFTLNSREGLHTLLDGVPTSLEPCKSGADPHHGTSLHISRVVCPE